MYSNAKVRVTYVRCHPELHARRISTGDRGPSSDIKAKAERLWDRMTYEVNLMTTRMNWLVVMQAFLFNAYFLGTGRIRENALATEFLVPLIPLIGLIMCRITRTYVATALKVLDVCRDELAELKDKFPRHFQDRVDLDETLPGSRKKVISASDMLIRVFEFFWILALILSLFLISYVAWAGNWFGLSAIDLSILGDFFDPRPIAVEVVTPTKFYRYGR